MASGSQEPGSRGLSRCKKPSSLTFELAFDLIGGCTLRNIDHRQRLQGDMIPAREEKYRRHRSLGKARHKPTSQETLQYRGEYARSPSYASSSYTTTRSSWWTTTSLTSFRWTSPFIKATLDGELLYMGPPDKSRGLMPGMRGVLEIKTGSYSTQKYLDKWTGTVVPEFYFAQVCQQLLVTGYDFAWVQAKLFRTDATYSRGDNSHLPETYEKSFFISRQDPSVIQSLPVIEDAHTEFWACVTEGRMPWSTIR